MSPMCTSLRGVWASSLSTLSSNRFGKYIKTCKSGLHYVNPLAEEIIMMDCKISVLDIPVQKLMTKGSSVC